MNDLLPSPLTNILPDGERQFIMSDSQYNYFRHLDVNRFPYRWLLASQLGVLALYHFLLKFLLYHDGAKLNQFSYTVIYLKFVQCESPTSSGMSRCVGR
jgi:hypothetical protein